MPEGLSRQQVAQQQAAGKVNRAVDNNFKSNRDIIKENVFTYFNLIFLVLALLLVLVQAWRDLTFLPVIIANTVIGIIQEIRAKHVLGKLQVLHAAQARVVRDGKEQKVDVHDLVLDDIILLKTGDQIPADAVVVQGQLSVNESLLTGESDEITKKKDAKLMSGSFVVSGRAYARLTAVGNDSYIAKLTAQAKAMGAGEQSEMVRSINKLIKWVGIIIIPLGIALFAQSFWVNKLSFARSITTMEAAIIGMIPEGLYLLTTIALALAAMRLARNEVMLHDMKSVETLARVNVLCVDKTGTITEHQMSVQKVVSLSVGAEDKLKTYIRNMPADNETGKALAAYAEQGRFEKADHIIPFTSVNKYAGCVIGQETYLLGAPEFVLKNMTPAVQQRVDTFAQKGMRVVAFVKTDQVLADEKTPLTGTVQPLALICLANPIREQAPATFKYFADQGVAVKVISGDNPETVARVAQQAKIPNSENYVDASTLQDSDLSEAVKKYTVFGRVKPNQKKALVQALQANGKTVAMTGDGVNDILAMKSADCSIAVASGNAAAVQAAQVVLLDSNFARMPRVVNEGRQVVNNIQRSASLFLVKNIFSLLMALFSLLMTISYPLQPSQITLISALTVGMPSFLLALEQNHKIIRGRFIPNVMARALPGGISDMLAVSILVLASQFVHLSKDDIGTGATLLLVLVGLLVLYHISAPLNKFRTGVLSLTVVALLLAISFLPHFFQLQMISRLAIFLLVVLYFASVTVFRWLSRLCDGVAEVINICDEKKHRTTWGDIKKGWRAGR
ncbi:MAG: HAD-IC family P-type ATPase [Lactobacillus sp.]